MYKIRNKIRLIEFFAGVGSKAMAIFKRMIEQDGRES